MKTMNIHIIMSLGNFCDYYDIIISHSYVASMRGPKIAKFASGYASFVLNVVCLLSLWFAFLRQFFWGILAFRIVETVCKPFTLFHSK